MRRSLAVVLLLFAIPAHAQQNRTLPENRDMVLLRQYDLTSVASLDIVGVINYRQHCRYQIDYSVLPSAASQIMARTDENNGASPDATSYRFTGEVDSDVSGTVRESSANGTQITMVEATAGYGALSGSARVYASSLILDRLGSAYEPMHLEWFTSYWSQSQGVITGHGSASRAGQTGPINAISIFPSTGTFNAVSARVYGIGGPCPLQQDGSFMEDTFVPPDAGVIDVTKPPVNAKCDGVTDDFAVLQQAVRAGRNGKRLLYIPRDRVCITSDQITSVLVDGTTWLNRVGWFGGGTGARRGRIQLKDNATGYQNAGTPRAVLYLASANGGVDGSSNEAFDNFIFDLVISCGSGNAGCMGIDFQGSNVSAIRRTEIRSEDGNAVTGLGLLRTDPGPLMLRDLKVTGFQHCIDVANAEYSITGEFIDLSGCSSEGIRNAQNSLALRKVTYTGSAPAMRNTATQGLIVCIECTFSGGNPANDAIVNSGGELFLRDVTSTGFARIVTGQGSSISEFSTANNHAFVTDDISSLRLPVQETPAAYFSQEPGERANIELYGAVRDDNKEDAVAFQRAMATGRPIIYGPAANKYSVSTQINVPASTRVIDMFDSNVEPIDANPGSSPDCVFNVAENSPNPLHVRRMHASAYVADGSVNTWCITSNRPVVFEDSYGGTVKVFAGAGNVYFDDVAALLRMTAGNKVWGRQFNPERDFDPLVDNAGGKLWILGLKTEGAQVSVSNTTAGGCTEILGGLSYPVSVLGDPTRPWHKVGSVGDGALDSKFMASMVQSAFAADRRYDIQMSETRSGVTQTVTYAQTVGRGFGNKIPLLSAHNGACTLP